MWMSSLAMLRNSVTRVLIGGCGITGAVTAALLRERLPSTCQIAIWEKSNGAGGRMCTHRSQLDDRCTVDIGAQYISTESANYSTHKHLYDELEGRDLLKSLTAVIEDEPPHPPGTRHFVTPQGISSLVKHFIEKAGVQPEFNQHVSHIKKVDKDLEVSSEQGRSEKFDCVILTFPVPQILTLQGYVQQALDAKPDVRQKLERVEYSSRYAVGLFYEPSTAINLPWSCKYINDPVVRFVSIDNKKRDQVLPDVGPSVVVHTSVPFGLANINRDREEVCSEIILPRLLELIPEIPEPAAVKYHKWRYSQVYKRYEGKPGMVVLSEDPLLVLGGDGFIASNLDNCMHSANKIVEAVLFVGKSDL